MNYNRLYFLLKFAAKEDSLRVLKEKLILVGKSEEEINNIISLLEPLSDRLCGRLSGAIIGILNRTPNAVTVSAIESLIESKTEQKEIDIENTPQTRYKKFIEKVEKLIDDNIDKYEIINYFQYSDIDGDLYKLLLQILFNNKKISLSNLKNLVNKINTLPTKYQLWLTKPKPGSAFQSLTYEELINIFPILKEYSEIEYAVIGKYENNSKFKDRIDILDVDIHNIENMSIEKMDDVIEAYRTVDLTININSRDELIKLPYEDKIGEVDDWELWLPSSQENSSAIARVNNLTLDPKTAWCTSKTKSQNFFNTYALQPNVLLFYIIKKNPESITDWLSIGYYNGQPFLGGQHAGISVDRSNNALNKNYLNNVLGSNTDKILDILTKKYNELNGITTALESVDISKLNNEYIDHITKNTNSSKLLNKVYKLIIERPANDMNNNFIKQIISNPNCSLDVRRHLAENTTNNLFLNILLLDSDETVKEIASNNPAVLEMKKESNYKNKLLLKVNYFYNMCLYK